MIVGESLSRKEKAIQTKMIAAVARLVLAAVLFSNVVGTVRAQDDTALSAEDERAFQGALASWRHFAEINEEVGLPPIGDEPRREDFVGYTEAQRDAVAAQETARSEAQARWEQRKAEIAGIIRPIVPAGQRLSDRRRNRIAAEFDSLREKAARSRQEDSARERAIDDLARKLGVPRQLITSDGRRLVLTDEIGGAPAYIGSHNTVAAASISADELWPLGAWPYSDINTGLSLTGAGQVLALWEVEGGVRTTHLEFGSRVEQRDSATLDVGGHATQVAGTMAAGGNGAILGSFAEGRGVAYGADVFAYDTYNFATERAAAAAGNETNPPVFVANHSWGLINAWRQEDITYQGNPIADAWVWYGPGPANFPEDVKFGLYTPTNTFGTGCKDVDLFLQADAPRHLMVYSCGNDRLEGPAASPGTYYRPIGQDQYVADATVRDWDDGDEGGYDSLSSPGTAKNVLTVGACEDVYHLDGQNVVFGFGPGANAVPAVFSGAGPTDDGRIKPELVAVGTPNLPLRQALGEVSGGYILGLISPTSGADNEYWPFAAGTSFSAPAVAGGFGLILERRAQLYPGLTEAEAWLGSTLKALAIDTCDDVGNPGPDYRMGHGIFDSLMAVERVEEDWFIGRGSLIKEFTLDVSQSMSWFVESDGNKPLSVTLVWSDPPGPALTSFSAPDPQDPMLINNLDVTVEHVDTTTTYLPWLLNPDLSGESATARGSDAVRGGDNRNNVERISIAMPPAGLYLVTVTHSGGLTGNPAPSVQPVSVVLGGVIPEPPVLTNLSKSPSGNEFLLTFQTDPGAYFLLDGTTDLTSGWTEIGSVLAEGASNAILLNSSNPRHFWRLRRAQ